MELPDMITPRLNTKTALGQALVSMFKSVEAELTLENAAPGAVKIIVFWWVRSAPLYKSSCLHGR
ncbi:hypothetical protein [Pseudomonas thivervalensis]|uniref:hypothetical protein n=1 Tax=Pseudomonas thivervalensis TaxID=86265 RepID=UPI00209F432E|nr:hypothetical protein [Pseudomonas thivervalensis]